MVYFTWVRPRILRQGTTANEIKMALPGDDLVKNPNFQYTQAITINAPRELVWGYLIQVGYQRAGWYNWDAFNRMAGKNYFYENNRSADRIIPELQEIKVGDKIYLAPPIGMDLEQMVDRQTLLLTGHEGDRYLVTWSFILNEVSPDVTRLLVRWNSRLGEGVAFTLVNLLFTEPGGAGIQQSLMLRGIKRRAERDFGNNSLH